MLYLEITSSYTLFCFAMSPMSVVKLRFFKFFLHPENLIRSIRCQMDITSFLWPYLSFKGNWCRCCCKGWPDRCHSDLRACGECRRALWRRDSRHPAPGSQPRDDRQDLCHHHGDRSEPGGQRTLQSPADCKGNDEVSAGFNFTVAATSLTRSIRDSETSIDLYRVHPVPVENGLKLEIRLHIYKAGTNTRSDTEVMFVCMHLIGSCVQN